MPIFTSIRKRFQKFWLVNLKSILRASQSSEENFHGCMKGKQFGAGIGIKLCGLAMVML